MLDGAAISARTAPARRRVVLTVSLLGCIAIAVVTYLVIEELPRIRLLWQGARFSTLSDGTQYRLDATGPHIDDADLRELPRHFPDLEQVFLRNAAITDATIDVLTRLERLTIIDLSGTQVTDAGLRCLHGTARRCGKWCCSTAPTCPCVGC